MFLKLDFLAKSIKILGFYSVTYKINLEIGGEGVIQSQILKISIGSSIFIDIWVVGNPKITLVL